MTELTAPFAAVQASLCAASQGMLADAVATPAVGEPFLAAFNDASVDALGGQITGDAPTAEALEADAAGLVSGVSTLTINGAGYIVRDKRSLGGGLTLLVLEKT